MSTEIAPFGRGGLPADTKSLIDNLSSVGANLQGGMGGVQLLRLLKSGWWAYGAERVEVEEGSKWALNPNSIEHGWACWGDGELIDERMVAFNQPAPVRGELPAYDEGWSQQMSMLFQCVSGEDTGTVVNYKGTSVGMRNAVKQLIDELVAQLQRDPKHCVPVVTFDVSSYMHKKHGEIFTPVIEVFEWVSFEGVEVDETEAADEGEDEAPDAEATDEKPKRRRRKASGSGKPEEKEKAADDGDATPSATDQPRRRRRAKRRGK